MNNLGRRAREREDRMHVSQQKKTELLFSYFIITVQICRAALLLYYLLSPLCELENFPNCAKMLTVQNDLLFSRQIKLKPIKCCNKTPSYHQLQIAPSI